MWAIDYVVVGKDAVLLGRTARSAFVADDREQQTVGVGEAGAVPRETGRGPFGRSRKHKVFHVR